MLANKSIFVLWKNKVNSPQPSFLNPQTVIDIKTCTGKCSTVNLCTRAKHSYAPPLPLPLVNIVNAEERVENYWSNGHSILYNLGVGFFFSEINNNIQKSLNDIHYTTNLIAYLKNWFAYKMPQNVHLKQNSEKCPMRQTMKFELWHVTLKEQEIARTMREHGTMPSPYATGIHKQKKEHWEHCEVLGQCGMQALKHYLLTL